MTFRPKILTPLLVLIASAHTAPSWSYGGGSSSSACREPQFFTESPAADSTVPSLTEFKFVASDTDASTLNVKINGKPVPATSTKIPNGDLNVSVLLANPVTTAGRVQILVDARSPDGCAGFKPYYIEVKP